MPYKLIMFVIFTLNTQIAHSDVTTMCPSSNLWAAGVSNQMAHFNKHNGERAEWRDSSSTLQQRVQRYTDDARAALSSNDVVQINCPQSRSNTRYYGFNSSTNVFAVSADNNRDLIVTAFTINGGHDFQRLVERENNRGSCDKTELKMGKYDDLPDYFDIIYEHFECELQPQLFSESDRCGRR